MSPEQLKKFQENEERNRLLREQAELNEMEEEPVDEEPKKRDRINTAKVLNNNYFSGDGISENYFAPSKTIQISPLISDQYDYAVTEDIVLLQERKDSAELLYKLFKESPYNGKFVSKQNVIKVPKEMIPEVFNYFRKVLLEHKKITAMEMVIAICEFFEFNYSYIYDKVLPPQIKADILDDYYHNMGMKDRMDADASMPLF